MTKNNEREQIESDLVKIVGHGTHKDWFMELEDYVYNRQISLFNEALIKAKAAVLEKYQEKYSHPTREYRAVDNFRDDILENIDTLGADIN